MALPKIKTVWNPAYAIKDSNSVMRWCEDTNEAGLRFVGFCDDILPRSISHSGWFIDNYESETIRGAVWQLPTRHGKECFLAGYWDPFNGEPMAHIDMEVEHCKEEAARSADNLCEYVAEDMRRYSQIDSNEQRIEELLEEITTLRIEHSELVRGYRKYLATDEFLRNEYHRRAMALQSDVRELVEKIKKLRHFNKCLES